MQIIKRLLLLYIGPFPAVLLGCIVATLFFAAERNLLSNDVIGGLAALMTTGYILTSFGNHLPIRDRLG